MPFSFSGPALAGISTTSSLGMGSAKRGKREARLAHARALSVCMPLSMAGWSLVFLLVFSGVPFCGTLLVGESDLIDFDRMVGEVEAEMNGGSVAGGIQSDLLPVGSC